MKTTPNRFRSIVAISAAAALALTACGGDDDDAAGTTPPVEEDVSEPSDEPAEAPAMSPSSLTLADQEGDGTSVLVGAVDLPASGFVAVHGDDGGSPGPVIGVSDLLDAGVTNEVVVTFDQPLSETGTVFPMVHIDTDGNGIYEFGAVEGLDGPGLTADGDVAVGPVLITIAGDEMDDDMDEGGEDADIPLQPSSIAIDGQASDGTAITIASIELPAPGFIAVHSDGGGSPGPVIGTSELLPAGTSNDVVVTLADPLTADATVFPMVHIDTDGNGIYEFGIVEGVDGPGLTADGEVAVVPGAITVEATDGEDAAATITIADFSFSGVTEVALGTTVVVTNTDGTPHTWTAVDGTFNSGSLSQSDTFEFTFTDPGEFEYFCNFHPSMTGTIVVTG